MMHQPHHLLFMSTISLMITLNLLIPPKIVTSSSVPHYVQHDCTRSDNSYTSGSIFEANLKSTLINILPSNDSQTVFSNITTGEGIDKVYSLAFCRGDIKGQDCRDCFEAAGRTVLQRCHLLKEGIIWYEECTLRYSNQSTIFSTDVVNPSHRNYNFSSILKSLDQHEKTFENLMESLIKQAAKYDNKEKLQGFATGETPVSSSSQNLILRGLVQCRPDIDSRPCETCLRSALKQMDGWSTTMIFLPSCNLRFDLYPSEIIKTPTSSRGRSVPGKVLIPVVVVASVVLSCCIIILIICCRRNRQKQQKPPHKPDVEGDRPPSVCDPENPAGARDPSAHLPIKNAQNLASYPEPSAPPLPEDHVNWQR